MSHQVVIYCCPCSAILPASEKELIGLLDEEERARYGRMRAEIGAMFLQGRRMVREVLAQRTGADLGDHTFRYSTNGKPLVANFPQYHISVSHCGSAVIAAVADCNLGVDLEQIDRQRGKLEAAWTQAERFMTPTTARWVSEADIDVRAERFTLLWTLMESHVKLYDGSIFRACRTLDIHLNGSDNDPLRAAVVGAEPCMWWGWRLVGELGNSILALATEIAPASIELWHWDSQGSHQPLPHTLISVPEVC